MEKTIIGLGGLPFTEQQLAQLEQHIIELGMEPRRINKHSREAADFVGCEVLLGHFTRAGIESATQLRWLHSDMAGVDKLVSFAPFASGQALLTNSSGAYGQIICEYLLGGIFALMRHLPDYLQAQREHRWAEPITALSLYERRVTVLGLGDIGSTFAKAAAALGAQVTAVKRQPAAKPDYLAELYTIDRLEQALIGCEILVITLPGGAGTANLIGAEQLSLLRPGALLLNSGRGTVLDTDALVAALQSGQLGRAMLDVLPQEPLPADSPLWDVPHLLLTPHISGRNNDPLPQREIWRLMAENLSRWAAGEELVNVVDVKQGY